jgi:hypothetical protein
MKLPKGYGYAGRGSEWVVDRDGVLVATAGHLHPGGLWTDLWVRRNGAKIRPSACWSRPAGRARRRCLRSLPRGPRQQRSPFRSKAKYFEPAGAVSWDVAHDGYAIRLGGQGPQGRRAVDERDV